jgi:hypothetical protein
MGLHDRRGQRLAAVEARHDHKSQQPAPTAQAGDRADCVTDYSSSLPLGSRSTCTSEGVPPPKLPSGIS